MPIRSTILVEDLAGIVADPERGTISLVGDHGGLALITGEIYDSSVAPGSIAIETEHGTVRLERGTSIQISEDVAGSLDSEDLCAINDALTALLSERFLWTADGDDDDDALNELTHSVGAQIADLINKPAAEPISLDGVGDEVTDRFDRIAYELRTDNPKGDKN